ncbi:MAG TPA: TMEM175 family protein [Ferruginibacter sp.]|nr:TMEM175 family protein [Ferruginibacter sp.]
MKSNRLEAFSDGVLAIIITIMVLGMKVPKGANFASLKEVLPSFISYLLSYAYVGIYWNNHHHLFQAIEKVNGKILWANLLLLFCLSLLPFTTEWMGTNPGEKTPVFIYGINLLLCAITYTILEKIAIKHEGKDSIIGKALENKTKEYASTALYIFAIVFSLYSPLLGFIGYSIVALIWIIPDRRIEKQLN